MKIKSVQIDSQSQCAIVCIWINTSKKRIQRENTEINTNSLFHNTRTTAIASKILVCVRASISSSYSFSFITDYKRSKICVLNLQRVFNDMLNKFARSISTCFFKKKILNVNIFHSMRAFSCLFFLFGHKFISQTLYFHARLLNIFWYWFVSFSFLFISFLFFA